MRFALQERGSLEELTSALEDEMVTRLGTGPVESDLAAFVVTAGLTVQPYAGQPYAGQPPAGSTPVPPAGWA